MARRWQELQPGSRQQKRCRPETWEVTQEEEQRFAVASDLANVCEYLEDSEVIKIRLIVNKAQARKDRAEKGDEK